MNDAEYRMNMDLVASAARLLLLVPVAELLDIVNHSETVGPILEPTAYQRGGADRLHEQRQVLEAALVLQGVARRFTGTQDVTVKGGAL